MNVMLNIPIEAGADRAGTSARRAGNGEAKAGDFRTLFDQVAQAPTAGRDLPAAPTPATEEGADTREGDAAARRAPDRHDGEAGVRDTPRDAMAETAAAPEEAETDRPDAVGSRRPDKDAPAARTERRQGMQAGRTDKGPAPSPDAARSAEPASNAAADASPPPTNDAPVEPVHEKAEKPSRKTDDVAMPAGSAGAPSVDPAAVPMAAPAADRAQRADGDAAGDRAMHRETRSQHGADVRTAPAVPHAASAASRRANAGAGSPPALTRDAGQADHADGDGIAVTGGWSDRRAAGPHGHAHRAAAAPGAAQPVQPGKSDEVAEGGNEAADHRKAADGRDAAPRANQPKGATTVSAPPPQPAAAQARSDVAVRHGGMHGTPVAAFAPPVDGSPDAPRADRRTPSAHGDDRPISVRVTASERHLAPLAPRIPPGGMPSGVADAAASAGQGVPKTASGMTGPVRTEAAAPDAPRPPRRNPAWRPLASAAGRGSPAPADAASGQKIAAHDDPIVVPDVAQRGERGRSQEPQGGTTGPVVPVPATPAGEKHQMAAGLANGGSAAAGTASAAPVAPATPLTAGVAAGIVGALAAEPKAPQPAPAGLAVPGPGAAAEPVRTIALNLDLQEHGQVDLRISLKGNAVSIHVKADRAETADALARDDRSLHEALRRAGYEAQEVRIDRREAMPARPGEAAASGQQQPAGGAGSGASGHAGGDQRGSLPQPRPQPQRPDGAFVLHDQETHDAPRQDRYRGPDRLYV